MHCLVGYMAMSSAVLLGVMGGAVWGAALEVFQIPCDAFTYYGVLWNFAVVGVVAIFYQKVVMMLLLSGRDEFLWVPDASGLCCCSRWCMLNSDWLYISCVFLLQLLARRAGHLPRSN